MKDVVVIDKELAEAAKEGTRRIVKTCNRYLQEWANKCGAHCHSEAEKDALVKIMANEYISTMREAMEESKGE